MGIGVDRLVMLLAGVDVDPRGDPLPAPATGADRAVVTKILVTGMGGELGHARRAAARAARVGHRDRRRRLRPAPPAPAPRRVPPHRPARPRQARRSSSRSRAERRRALRRLRTVVAHDARLSALERTELCTIAALSAGRARGQPRVRRVRSGLEVYGPRSLHASVPDEERHARAGARPTARRCSQVEAIAAGRARCATACRRVRVALRAGRRLARSEPARPVAAAARRAGARVRRSAVLVAASRRRRRRDGRRDRAPLRRPAATSSARARRHRGRRCASAAACPIPVLPPFWGAAARVIEVAGAAIAPHVVELLRHGRTGSSGRAHRRARPHRPAVDAAGAARAVRVGRTSSRSRPHARRSHDRPTVDPERRSTGADYGLDRRPRLAAGAAAARRCAAASAAAIRSIRSGSIRSSPI